MSFSKYRYRPVHAIAERLLEIAGPILRSAGRTVPGAIPRKILVLKFGGMGEAVLARSLVERLQQRHPRMTFDFLVERRTVEMMTLGQPGKVMLYTPGTDGLVRSVALLRAIRRESYDAVLDFEQHSLLTAAFARATSIPMRVGFDSPTSGPRAKMFTDPVPLRETESMWQAFIRVGQVVDPELPSDLMTTPLPTGAAAFEWLGEWSESKGLLPRNGRVVAMHVGVGPSAQYRRWPLDRFIALANCLAAADPDVTVLLTGSKEERELIAEFQRQFPGRSVDASDTGSLEHTAALLQNCDLVVSADTGIMHLAAAMGTPTIGLFGPNTPICWAPVGIRATYVYPTKISCSPCINSYRRQIPPDCIVTPKSACMLDITIDDVVQAAKQVIQGNWLGERHDLVSISKQMDLETSPSEERRVVR